MRKTMRQMREAATYKGANPQTIVKWRNNGVRYTDMNECALGFMLHNTEIVRKQYNPDGVGFTIILDTGGFNSVTTRRAMNEALRSLNLDMRVYQRKHRLYVDGVEFYGRVAITRHASGTRYHTDTGGPIEDRAHI